MNIIAYGSLMNKNSLEKTLQRKTILTKIIIPNVRRVFNAPFGEYSFLNIEKCKNSFIEAGYFTLDKNEIERFKEREAGSELQELLSGFYAFFWPKNNCKKLPVLKSYINVCNTGATELNINFWVGTKKPKQIIDDTDLPLY